MVAEGQEDKKCSKCGETKSLEHFYRRGPGFRPDCKSCIRRRTGGHYHANRDSIRAKSREDYKARPEKHKGRLLKAAYGIGIEEYRKILEMQQHACGICRRHETTFVKALAADHDHKTGQIRGLLCMDCNTGLGKLGDSAESILMAYQYLIRPIRA